MQRTTLLAHLRRTLWARWVAVWLLSAFTVALAAPVVQPQAIELLCTGSGSVRLLVGGSDETDTSMDMSADCALCLQASAPPPSNTVTAKAQTALSCPLQHATKTQSLRLTAPPLPARGPPSPARL